MPHKILPTAIALLVMAGCASKPAPPAVGSSTEILPSPSNVHRALVANWDGPDGWTAFATFEEVVERVTVFTPYEPKSLSEPSIFIPPSQSPAAVMLVYDDPTFGRVWVTEELPGFDTDDRRREAYESRVADNRNADIINTAEIVTIRGSNFGLLRYSDDSVTTPTNIEWVENGVQFQVVGKTLNTQQAVELANSI